MRTGSPTWKIKIDLINLKLDCLTQISFPKDKNQEQFIDNVLTEDIKNNGLLHPLEINLLLEETKWHELRVFKGNQRIRALRNLGWTEAPCNLTIEGYPDNEELGKIFIKLFGDKNGK